MAVAFDAFSTGVDSITHTPAGTPRGVMIVTQRITSEAITAKTYGGVDMGSPLASIAATSGELNTLTMELWHLGASVPTGAQTVAYTGGASGVRMFVYSVTAAADTEYVSHQTIRSDSAANPSATIALSARTCFVAQAFGSGQNDVTGTTPFSGWTSRSETDLGTIVVGGYSYDTIGTADVTVGLTQTADDILLMAGAVSEVVAATARQQSMMMLGMGH